MTVRKSACVSIYTYNHDITTEIRNNTQMIIFVCVDWISNIYKLKIAVKIDNSINLQNKQKEELYNLYSILCGVTTRMSMRSNLTNNTYDHIISNKNNYSNVKFIDCYSNEILYMRSLKMFPNITYMRFTKNSHNQMGRKFSNN